MLKRDDAYFEGLDFRNGEGLDFPVEGKAKIKDSITDKRFFSGFVGVLKPEA